MAEYLVELYVTRTNVPDVEPGVTRAMLGGEELPSGGAAVRCVRSIFVPEDETWFLLYEAGSVNDVRDAARSANLPVQRIVEAVAGVATTSSDERSTQPETS